MKERKISRRAVCSAMVASLALGVLEGCGSSSSTTSSAAGSGAAASNERITVRILKSKAANEVAAEQMDVWKVLGEKFNMDFEFDNPPQDNYNERLNLVMMDAQLPDIIMDMPTTEVLKYGQSGVILSLMPPEVAFKIDLPFRDSGFRCRVHIHVVVFFRVLNFAVIKGRLQ